MFPGEKYRNAGAMARGFSLQEVYVEMQPDSALLRIPGFAFGMRWCR
jgi:hypothetical protein